MQRKECAECSSMSEVPCSFQYSKMNKKECLSPSRQWHTLHSQVRTQIIAKGGGNNSASCRRWLENSPLSLEWTPTCRTHVLGIRDIKKIDYGGFVHGPLTCDQTRPKWWPTAPKLSSFFGPSAGTLADAVLPSREGRPCGGGGPLPLTLLSFLHPRGPQHFTDQRAFLMNKRNGFLTLLK